MSFEEYTISPESMKLLRKIIAQYDLHEKREVTREAKLCRACPYYKTCKYSIHSTSAEERKDYRARTDDS